MYVCVSVCVCIYRGFLWFVLFSLIVAWVWRHKKSAVFWILKKFLCSVHCLYLPAFTASVTQCKELKIRKHQTIKCLCCVFCSLLFIIAVHCLPRYRHILAPADYVKNIHLLSTLHWCIRMATLRAIISYRDYTTGRHYSFKGDSWEDLYDQR